MRYIKGKERKPKVCNQDFKTVGIDESGDELYYNPDFQLVRRSPDETIGYRVDEMHEDVVELLDKMRARYYYPTKNFINHVIKMQEESVTKACNYIKYIKLGEATYLDVYGAEATARYAEERHRKEQQAMKEQLDQMQQQLKDMQLILFNIANNLNHNISPKNNRRIG